MTLNGRADLHIHTCFSDGSYEPTELVRRARDLGFSVIAVTDHDSVGAVDEAAAEGNILGVRVVPGVELSARCDDAEIHIIGLFVDHANRELLRLINRAAAERRTRAVRTTEILADLGVHVSAEEVFAESDGASVGRLHVAEVLVRCGAVSSIAQAFYQYLGNNRPACVPKWSPSPEECCRIIHEAGGVAVFAHPGGVIDERRVRLLVEAGCQALEAYYPTYPQSLTEAYVNLAAELGVGVAGGSDCHGSRKVRTSFGTVSVPMEFVEDLERRCG